MVGKTSTLYLIDAHAQLYRSYHAIRPGSMLAADHKTPTNAVFGFGNIVRRLRTRFKPDLLAAVFDPVGPVKREELYQKFAEKLGKAFSGYKAHRVSMPDDLRPQISLAIELCEAYGIPALQMEGYEADDVLGTLAQEASAKNLNVVIVTGDKDLLQLVRDGISVYDPMKEITYNEEMVFKLKGVKPNQITDWLGFMGDASDNIPGVTGVGEQTAVKLLQTHGSMEAVLAYYRETYEPQAQSIAEFIRAHEAESELPKEQRKGVKPPKGVKVVDAYLFAEAERALASRELARLTLDLPIKLDLEKLRCRSPEVIKLAPLLNRLDFSSYLRDLDPEELKQYQAKVDTTTEVAAVTEPQPAVAHILVDNEKSFDAFLIELKKQKRFALDTETTGLDPRTADLVGIAFSWQAFQAYYLPVRGPLGCRTLELKPTLAALADVFTNPKIEKIGHNIKYDLQVLRHHGLDTHGVTFDTMIAGWLLDPGTPRLNLDELSQHYLNLRKKDLGALLGKGKQQITLDLAPMEAVCAYACQDADCTWQLGEKLAPLIKEAGLEPLLREIEAPLIEVLANMEWIGIRVDGDLLRGMSNNLEQQLVAQEIDIYALAGEKFNINSPQQLGALLFNKLGLASKGKTATGQDSTSEEVLLQLSKDHRLPRMILDYRSMLKLKNTYLDALPALISPKSGRIHASFHQTGTETGRLSSSNPNLQNIPIRSQEGRAIRAAFKPGYSDWKIVTADYSQIELRILAHYSDDQALIEAFEKGVDIHTAVAARLFNCNEKDVTREQRAKAKTMNFGIIYGQTAFGLAGTLSISRAEAQNSIDTYFSNHPGVRQCIKKIVDDATQQGFVTTVLGRRRFIPQLRASDYGARALGERLAVNTVFQGSAADLIKKAMLEIYRELQSSRGRQGGWQANMILQIHDELLFECPSEEVDALVALVKDRMENALKLNVPLVVDVGIGNDWLEAGG
ncbi:MAG: DNA polymerase I [Planctomycetota bacterium]